jgi:hypothetical protein
MVGKMPFRRALAAVTSTFLVMGAYMTSVADAAARVDRQEEITMCEAGGPRPCIVSALRNGEPLGEDYRVIGSFSEGKWFGIIASFHAMRGQMFDLGFDSLTDTWTITVDMGAVTPRVVHGRAIDTTVNRRIGQGAEGGNLVTVTGRPVTLSGQCDAANNCPEWAESPTSYNQQWDGTFNFAVADFGSWSEDEQADFYGINYFSNIAVGVVPPAMRQDEQTGEDYMYIELANRHYLEDGVTVVKGAVDIRLPDRFLREKFGIPNPGTMTDTSLTTTVGGAQGGRGTVTVRRSAADDAMEIEIRNVTFSRRVARVELGTVRPTAPRGVRAQPVRGALRPVESSRREGHQLPSAVRLGQRP